MDVVLHGACRQVEAAADAQRRVLAGAPVGGASPVALRRVDGALEALPLGGAGHEAVVGVAGLDALVEDGVHGGEALQVVQGLTEHEVVLRGAVDVDVAVVLIGVGACRAAHGAELSQVTLTGGHAEAGLVAGVVVGGAGVERLVEEAGYADLRRTEPVLVGILVGEVAQQCVGLVLRIVVDDGRDGLVGVGLRVVPDGRVVAGGGG